MTVFFFLLRLEMLRAGCEHFLRDCRWLNVSFGGVNGLLHWPIYNMLVGYNIFTQWKVKEI